MRQLLRELWCRFTGGHDYERGTLSNSYSGPVWLTTTYEYLQCVNCDKIKE